MKFGFFAFLLAMGVSSAQAAVLECKVNYVDGRFSSYLPPDVGQTIQIDLAAASITELYFNGTGASRLGVVGFASPLVRQAEREDAPGVIWSQRSGTGVGYDVLEITWLRIDPETGEGRLNQAWIDDTASGGSSSLGLQCH